MGESNSIRIISPGLQTTVQDFPGRMGHRGFAISTAGPLDDFSFRLANFLAGNAPDKAGLEIQFTGPEIEFNDSRIIALCGADNAPQKNGTPIELWQAHEMRKGDRLSFGYPRFGARTYLAVSGGIDTPVIIGSRATDTRLNLGGLEGRALMAEDVLKLGMPNDLHTKPLRLKKEHRPTYSNTWDIAVVRGPCDDYFSDADIQLFLSAPWQVSSKSNRMGYRLQGPSFEFSALAHQKAQENGGDFTTITNYGVPVGAINVCGQTPIILLRDSFTITGYICPFTVTFEDIRKVAQARPGDLIYFHEVPANPCLRDPYFDQHLKNYCEPVL